MLIAILTPAMADARAGEGEPKAVNISETVEMAPGIRTDRLSPRQLVAWRAIEAIVLGKDASGRFNHPKLQSLWQWVETSGHVIYVELPDPKDRCDHQAGRFRIEKADIDRQKYIAVIRLCLSVIDGALVRKRARNMDGFIQYEGLSREERYAEALGHELAHAVWILGDRSHARLIEALDREVEEFNNRRREAVHGVAWDEQARQSLRKMQSWIGEIETPAETAEAEVWQELRKSQGTKTDISILHRNN